MLGKRDTDARNSLHRKTSNVDNKAIAAAAAHHAKVKGGDAVVPGADAKAATGLGARAAADSEVSPAGSAAAGAAAVETASFSTKGAQRSARAPSEARAERIAMRRLSAGASPGMDSTAATADGVAEVAVIEEALEHLHNILSPHTTSRDAPWSKSDAWQADVDRQVPAQPPPLWEKVHASAVPSGRSEPPWIKYRDTLSKRRFWRNADTGETAWADDA